MTPAALRTTSKAVTIWFCAVALSVVADGRADGSPLSRARTQAGYALAYDLRFAEAYDRLDEAIAADSSDPAPRRAIAAIVWMEILFAQGVATFEAFNGEISKSDVIRPPAPPALAARFRQAIGEATDRAARQLSRADSADSHYQVGATAALVAVYGATVEGKTLGSLSQGRTAVSAMTRARERDPRMHEAAMVLGMSQYTVSTLSWPVRTLARLAGLSGNREAALALLHEASASGTETESDALMLLMIVDNREKRHADALPRLAALQRRHPSNRLLWLNRGAAALLAGLPEVADRELSLGIIGRGWEGGPAVLGEAALWLAHRGTARVRLQRLAEAASDLGAGLAARPRDWVRGRIHAQLASLAFAAGDLAAARRELQAAVEFADRGGDQAGAHDARQRLRAR